MPNKDLKTPLFFSLKLLGIIAFWETLIMLVFTMIGSLHPLVATVIDTTSLTLLSGLSIWFLIMLPENKKIKKYFLASIHLLNQKTDAIDQIGIVVTTDLSGKITYANDIFCKISGYSREELIMKDHRILNSGHHSKEFFRQMWSNLKSGRPWRGQIRNKNKNGEFYWLESYIFPILDSEGNPSQYASFRFDITAEKLVEEALEQEKIKSIHMGRLSAIGEMAAGIAHEINNPLSIINVSLSMIERKLQSPNLIDERPKISLLVSKAQSQVIRTNKIINGLREFSRSGDNQPFENISVTALMNSVSDLCSEKLNRLGVRFEIKAGEIECQCNPIQIEQVLVNLINNSVDAISILDEKWIKLEAVLVGGFVEISVTDSGHGISQEIAQKIMRPFFTTKEIGKGTGLGLSISRGIIEKHGGTLYPDTEAQNTRFVIQMPQHEAALIDLINTDQAISSHLAWRHKLLTHFKTPNLELDWKIVGADNQCDLGKWINKIEPRFKDYSYFIELKMSHTEFHKCAGEVVRCAHEGDFAPSELTLGSGSNYDGLSKRVVSALQAFRLGSSSSKVDLKKCG